MLVDVMYTSRQAVSWGPPEEEYSSTPIIQSKLVAKIMQEFLNKNKKEICDLAKYVVWLESSVITQRVF